MFEIAEYFHSKSECGYTAAQDFQIALNQACSKIAEAPLQNSSDWANPLRRAFFNCKGQYTLLFVFNPPTAKTNQQISHIIFSDIYPSASAKGNTPRPEEKKFIADDLLKD